MTDNLTRSAFDQLAARHDHARWEVPAVGFDRRVERTLAEVAIRGRGRVLALGGGSGRELAHFAEYGWDCSLVDFSARMLDLARHRLPERVEITHADVDDAIAMMSSSRYHVVLAVGELLCYIGSPTKTLAAAARILRPGGRLVITFAETWRCHAHGLEKIGSDDFGVLFNERTDIPVSIRGLSIVDVLGWLGRLGMRETSQFSGLGPRACVVAVKPASLGRQEERKGEPTSALYRITEFSSKRSGSFVAAQPGWRMYRPKACPLG